MCCIRTSTHLKPSVILWQFVLLCMWLISFGQFPTSLDVVWRYKFTVGVLFHYHLHVVQQVMRTIGSLCIDTEPAYLWNQLDPMQWWRCQQFSAALIKHNKVQKQKKHMTEYNYYTDPLPKSPWGHAHFFPTPCSAPRLESHRVTWSHWTTYGLLCDTSVPWR